VDTKGIYDDEKIGDFVHILERNVSADPDCGDCGRFRENMVLESGVQCDSSGQ
jgi:hypothetical protein